VEALDRVKPKAAGSKVFLQNTDTSEVAEVPGERYQSGVRRKQKMNIRRKMVKIAETR
jgi:hypothetical protein